MAIIHRYIQGQMWFCVIMHFLTRVFMLECENWVQDFMGMKWPTRRIFEG
jgi:hypothetical protein